MRVIAGSYSVAIVAGISALAALWEATNRHGAKSETLRKIQNRAETEQIQVMAKLYPGSPLALSLEGFRARARGDLVAARDLFAAALADDFKDTEAPFYYYLDCLVRLGADSDAIEAAARNWRRNFPDSTMPDPRSSSGVRPLSPADAADAAPY